MFLAEFFSKLQATYLKAKDNSVSTKLLWAFWNLQPSSATNHEDKIYSNPTVLHTNIIVIIIKRDEGDNNITLSKQSVAVKDMAAAPAVTQAWPMVPQPAGSK